MSGGSRKALAGGCLLLVGLAVWMAGGRAAALSLDWLGASDPPAAADLIVVVSGGARERLLTALELYRRGLAPAILLTDATGFPDREMRELVSEGVHPSALLAPLRPSGSTRDDALCIREVILRKGIRSVLVVTSPYHCRRLMLILRRTLGDLDVSVRVTPSASLYIQPARWWKSWQGWRLIPAEYFKLIWAWTIVPKLVPVAERRQGS